MELETTRENIIVNKLINQKKETIIVEGDIIVPDVKPDVLSIINTTGTVCICKKETLDEKIKLEGNINLNIIYLADAQTDFIRSLNTILDFTKIIDINKCKSKMNLRNNIHIKNIECKILNGRKINIKVILEADVSIFSNEDINILKDINNNQNIQILNSNVSINNLIGTGCCRATAKDTIEVPNGDILEEILKTSININNKETKVSYNKVLIKADSNVKIMYLTDQQQIKVINSTIPIMGFIDISNISESDILSCEYEIKNIIIKINSNEKNSIYVEIEFEINCDAMNTINLELIQDMYLPTKELQFSMKEISTISNKKQIKKIYSIKNDILIPEISNGVLYDVDIIPNLSNTSNLNGKIVYDGDLELNFIFAKEVDNGRLETINYKMPFTFEIENEEITSNKIINTNLNIVDSEFNIVTNSAGTINFRIELEFETDMYSNANINLIDKINVNENEIKDIPSMIIYIVKKEDTMWNIAKKYRTTTEEIVNINNLENPSDLKIRTKIIYTKIFKKANCIINLIL